MRISINQILLACVVSTCALSLSAQNSLQANTKSEQLLYSKEAKIITSAFKAATIVPQANPTIDWDMQLMNFGNIQAPKPEAETEMDIAKKEAMNRKLSNPRTEGQTENDHLSINNTIGLKVANRFRVNFGSSVPPDNTAAISNDGNIVSVVNSNIVFYTEDGTALMNDQNLSTFYQDVPNISSFIFDPKVMYDPEDDRFILVLLTGNTSATSQLVLSFSSSSNPMDEWYHYVIDGDPSDKGIWTDFPSIGFNGEDIFISGNLFTDPPYSFEETVIWQMDKDAGYAGEDELATVIYEDVEIPNGNNAFTVKPAILGQTGDYGPEMYMVCTRWGGNRMILFEVDDKTENNPTLSAYNVNLDQDFTFPPNGIQLGANEPIGTGDTRVKSSIFLNGKIHTVFSSEHFSGYAGIYVSKIDVNTLEEESVILGENGYDWGHPSIASFGYDSNDETLLIGYLRTGEDIYPEMRAIVVDEDLSPTQSVLIKSGESPITVLDSDPGQPATVQRWGDYSFAFRKFNETTPTVWFTGCYGLFNSYGNFIGEIQRVENPGPAEAEFSANPQEGFLPLEVEFTDESTGDNLSYFWEFEYGTPGYSTEQNPVVNYEQLGTFYVKLTINNGLDQTIVKEDYIQVNPNGIAPVAAFTSDITIGQAPLVVNFTDLSENDPEQRLWSFPGGSPTSSSEVNPTVTYNNPGSFKVRLNVQNEAGFDSEQIPNYIVVEAPTATQETAANIQTAKVFPNPASERFTLEFQLNEKMIISIDIRNIDGSITKHFFREAAKSGRNQFSFSTAPLSSGIYFVEISDASGNIIKSEKLIVN